MSGFLLLLQRVCVAFRLHGVRIIKKKNREHSLQGKDHAFQTCNLKSALPVEGCLWGLPPRSVLCRARAVVFLDAVMPQHAAASLSAKGRPRHGCWEIRRRPVGLSGEHSVSLLRHVPHWPGARAPGQDPPGTSGPGNPPLPRCRPWASLTRSPRCW